MKILKIILLFLFVISASAVDVEIEINKKEVVLGDSFQLMLRFEYDGEVEPFVSFEPANAEIVGDNTNSNNRVESRVYFSGGKAVQKKIYTLIYQLQAVKPGIAHIKDIKIDFGGNIVKLRTQSVKILAEAREMAEHIVQAEVSKEEAFKGESISLDYYLYFKNEVANIEIKKFPSLEKFLKRFELPKAGVESVNLQGQIYKRVLLYRAKIFPENIGELTIDPLEISFQYPEMIRRQQDVFGMSMMFSGGRYKTKSLKSGRIKVKINPLPSENVPKNFSGLVGDHEFNLTITKEKILVNDVIEARLEVTGDGALEKFDPPKIIENDGLEEFDAKTEIIELGNLMSKKVIDYTFLGKKAIESQAYEFKISIFDPEKRSFVEKTLSIPALTVFGTGASTQVLDTKAAVKNEPTKNVTQKPKVLDDFVAPLASNSKGKLFNLNWLSLVLFIIACLSILGPISLLSKLFKSSYDLPKKLSYEVVHDFILQNTVATTGLRDVVQKKNISKEAKSYFIDLISILEKNEYKNAKISTKMNKKYFIEYIKESENENS